MRTGGGAAVTKREEAEEEEEAEKAAEAELTAALCAIEQPSFAGAKDVR